MRPIYDFDFMTFARGAQRSQGCSATVFADHEESCFNVVSREDVQQFRVVSVAPGPSSKVIAMYGAIDVDGTEGNSRFRQDIPVVLFRSLALQLWRSARSVSRDETDRTEEKQTGDGHERTWQTECVYLAEGRQLRKTRRGRQELE